MMILRRNTTSYILNKFTLLLDKEQLAAQIQIPTLNGALVT